MRPARARLVALFVLGLAPAAGLAAEGEPPPATPRIYRWIDENGVAHYTADENQIPSLRRRFGLPTQPLEREPLDAGAPVPAPVPAPTPAPAPDPAPALPSDSSAADAWASQERGTQRAPAPPAASADPAPSAAPVSEPSASGERLPDVAADAPSDAQRLEQVELRIAELSAAIAADEDALTAWIGDPNAGDSLDAAQTPELREIAKRLPKRIQELEALRTERDALQPATP